MREQLEDRNVVDVVPLTSPRALKSAQPMSEKATALVLETRLAIRDILHARDERRVLVVVGPCSIHDREIALEYARRLHPVAQALRDTLLIVMRTYFEKPRTTVGWKGLVNDPHLDGSCDVEAGLRLARTILTDINDLGVPCGSEVLDPITPQYLSDLLSWASIGARTIESQTHRELASGLSMPVGFKNSTAGGLQVALQAMISARHPHTFLGIDTDGATAMIKTQGNPDRHVVLRGGAHGPNHAAADVAHAAELVAAEGVARPIMVDCSHDNSGKDHTRQAAVCREVLAQVRLGRSILMGLLLESNLQPGKQTWAPGRTLDYGVSITDACMGWEETEPLLYEIAGAVAAAPVAAASA